MSCLPIIAHDRPDAIAAYRGGRPITAAQFLQDVATLATALPAAGHVLNLCDDRYRFATGLAASLLRGQRSVLPSAHTPEVIRQLRSFAPDVFCLTDDPDRRIDLPRLLCPPLPSDNAAGIGAPPTAFDRDQWSVPQIDERQLAAFVFTSGSTGTPLPHAKTWGRLVDCVRAEAARLGAIASGGRAILGTVPAQHMYGLESTVLLPLLSGGALCAERPFFPADVAESLRIVPEPRVLFSTPVHLRALLSSEQVLPALEMIVSATAMLSANLAREVENRYGAPLLEIYGSTETGQIATRRTAQESAWRLWPGVQLTITDGGCVAHGGHVAGEVPLADVVESVDDEHFLLHGRTADLVNIAGKRSSIGYLNHQLNAIEGVLDGVFFIREDAKASLAGITRLAALVVAPRLDAASITQALRERIDPVFLPRPLLLIEQLPRNETGKLPQQAIQALAAQAAARQPHLFT